MKTLAALAVALAMASAVPASAQEALKSIKPLGVVHPDGSRQDVCTVWHTKVGPQNIGIWVGKDHCTGVLGEGDRFIIDGKPAILIGRNADLDLAMWTGPHAPGLRLGFGQTPKPGTPVYSFGFAGIGSYYKGGIVYTQGVVSAPSIEAGYASGYVTMALLVMPDGPGASGAPVMVKGDIVVGVVDGGPAPWSGFTTASRLQDLRLFLFGE